MITYKKLQPHDHIKYREVRLESLKEFPDAFGASYEDEAKAPQLRFEFFIEQQLPDKFMLGAFNDEQLIGICGFIQEEQARSRHRGLIVQMYVKPAFTGKGVGRQLLKAVTDNAFDLPQLELITLGVVTDNLAAIKIYRNAGFEQYGILKNYYHNGAGYLDHSFMALYK